MEKKRSKIVTILGWIFIIHGFFGFILGEISGILYVSNKELLLKIYENILQIFTTNSELSQATAQIMVVSRENTMYFVNSILIFPIISLMEFLGGIGILKLQEKWRKNLVIIITTSYFLHFLATMFTKLNIYMYITVGALRNLENGTKMSTIVVEQFDKIQSGLFSSAIACFIYPVVFVYFLTRPKVKEQFK